MTQRTLAGLIALPLVVALVVVAWVVPLPYTVYSPGPTVDILGSFEGKPIVQVPGHRVYRDDGELRMTTVSETTRTANLGLLTLLSAWASRDDAVYPHSVAYPDQSGTTEQDRKQGAVQMTSAQDAATAAALHQLGYDVDRVVVTHVEADAPAAGVLRARDLIRRVDGTAVETPAEVAEAVQTVKPGTDVRMRIERGGKPEVVTVKAGDKDGKGYLGISLGATYDFPFQVKINIDPSIGGPSAGLMMALSVYDTLTPGSLTDGAAVAGTGTIDGAGTVGVIGGIQQKIPGARRDGARLFLVPAGNCQDVDGADNGDMRLAKVTTLDDALSTVEAWTKDHDARLPQCGSGS